MPRRPGLEIADIFRRYGSAWRRANAGHVSLTQLKVMSATEACRTEALGGHVAACGKCGHHHIAYNSCKNRHCPKCQGPAARDWMEARADDLLPVEYFHVVFTLPAGIARIAFWNKRVVYGLLFRAAAETVMTIASDPKAVGCACRHDGGAAHLGFGADPPSTHPHDRAGRWAIARWHQMGRLQAGFLSARARVVAPVSAPVSGRADGSASRRGTRLLRGPDGARGYRDIRRLPYPIPQDRMGGLCQAALRRPRGRADLSQPIHPSRRHLEPPSCQRRRRDRGLPLEGLSHQSMATARGSCA